MKAMVIAQGEQGSFVEQIEMDEPQLVGGSVLIEVHAASVNRADLAALTGNYVANPLATGPTVVGLDAAGIVLDADQQSGFVRGDRVMTLVAGGLAERVAVDSRLAIGIPDTWSLIEGAGAVLGLLTAHNAIVAAGRLRSGDNVFVNGASSATGQMAIRIAKYLGAGMVIAGARTSRDEEFLRSLGADHFVTTGSGGFAPLLSELTQAHGIDVTVDHVGGPYLADHVEAAAVQSRLVSVGRLGGVEGRLNLDTVALKRMELIGVTFRTRTIEEKAALVAAARVDLSDAMETGVLKPRIDSVREWSDVASAYAAVASNGHLGKVVLTLKDED